VLERLINLSWYGKVQWTWLLWPLSLLYGWVVKRKRQAFLESGKTSEPVPVIIVGNITVGGTGKTPVVQSLVRHLQTLGYQPGIISRGYGGTQNEFPHLVTTDDASERVGDEPYMLSRSLSVPVVIDPVRKQALNRVLEEGVNVVISDDGLQHYQLHRDVEICVIDGSRGLGNGQLIPVGPMREPKDRLSSVDFVLSSSKSVASSSVFTIEPVCWVNVKNGEAKDLGELEVADDSLAIAGIGNPNKFFETLSELNIRCENKSFDDHYPYSESDFTGDKRQILMTEKDAVKIAPFAHDDMWFLQIQAALPETFLSQLVAKLEFK